MKKKYLHILVHKSSVDTSQNTIESNYKMLTKTEVENLMNKKLNWDDYVLISHHIFLNK